MGKSKVTKSSPSIGGKPNVHAVDTNATGNGAPATRKNAQTLEARKASPSLKHSRCAMQEQANHSSLLILAATAGIPTNLGGGQNQTGADVTEKVKELVRLAKEQGYLTYGDINDALPDNAVTPEELDEIYTKLRNLEIDIVDQAEVDRVKQPEEEEVKGRLDILDDPVRMYLKQMGQVALLTREQEVEISKRIESAELEVKRIICGFGFAAKEHIALAEKLISEPPKERFDRVIVDKKIDSREIHLKSLRKLVKQVRLLDQQVDEKYADWRNGSSKSKREKLFAGF